MDRARARGRGAARLAPVEIFVADPQVMLLGLLGIQLLHPGFVEQARARLQQAHARARLLGQPNTRLAASGTTRCSRCDWATPSVSRLWPTRCGRSSTNSRSRKVEPRAGGFAAGRTPGWDDRARAIAAFERRTKTIPGSGCWREEARILGYATEALVLAGDWDGAQHELEEALQFANTLGERVYLPQLFLMEAAIARARGDRAAADAAIRRAIAEARAQEAPWLELMALIELCDHDSATAEDRRALAALVDQLPEAIDTAAAGESASTARQDEVRVDHACSCSARCGRVSVRRRTADSMT